MRTNQAQKRLSKHQKRQHALSCCSPAPTLTHPPPAETQVRCKESEAPQQSETPEQARFWYETDTGYCSGPKKKAAPALSLPLSLLSLARTLTLSLSLSHTEIQARCKEKESRRRRRRQRRQRHQQPKKKGSAHALSSSISLVARSHARSLARPAEPCTKSQHALSRSLVALASRSRLSLAHPSAPSRRKPSPLQRKRKSATTATTATTAMTATPEAQRKGQLPLSLPLSLLSPAPPPTYLATHAPAPLSQQNKAKPGAKKNKSKVRLTHVRSLARSLTRARSLARTLAPLPSLLPLWFPCSNTSRSPPAGM
jgi:hypothetical protein